MKLQRPHFQRDGHRGRHQAPPVPAQLPRIEDDDESVRDGAEAGVRREAEYLRRLTEERTSVEVHLKSGEKLRGYIEYYDQRFIRLTRKGEPNLFIFKQDIKYLAETEEE